MAADVSPIAVWHFDEPAGLAIYDSTGNDYDGQLNGAQRVPGLFGSALQCDGVDDYAQVTSPGAMSEGTVEVWAKILARPQGQVGVITFGAGARSRNDAAVLGLAPDSKGASNKWGFGICHSTWESARSDQEPPLNEWVHLAGSWGPRGLRFYINGSLAATADTKITMPSHSSILFGAGAWLHWMKVIIDEARLYERQLPDKVLANHVDDRSYVLSPRQITPLQASAPRPIINAADYYNPESPSSGLQEAIDAAGKHGGIVTIPPGTYYLERSLRLRSNTTLRGSGASTILKKRPEVISPLTKDAKVGDHVIEVKDTTGFRPGMEVAVMDDQTRGWYTTHALIERVEGNKLTLDVALHKDRSVALNALAVSYFPAITAEHQHNVIIQGLSIDGDMANQPSTTVTCFTLSAIHLYACDNCQILDISVTGWPGDGIGVQGGRFARVSGCTVTACRGHGFHPGTCIRDSVWTNLVGANNGWDGLYFCAQCQGVVLSNSMFTDNGWSGIGGLGDGNDKYNTVIGNVCRRNGRAGITMATSGHNTVTANLCLDNSRSAPGQHPGILVQDTTDNVITGNRCSNSEEPPTQKHGIEEKGSSDRNLISGNYCRGNMAEGVVVVGKETENTANSQ